MCILPEEKELFKIIPSYPLDCSKCLKCCSFENTTLIKYLGKELSETEISSIVYIPKEMVKVFFRKGKDGFLITEKCRFYDKKNGKCKIYSKRPFLCYIYPIVLIKEINTVYITVCLLCPEASKIIEGFANHGNKEIEFINSIEEAIVRGLVPNYIFFNTWPFIYVLKKVKIKS